MWPPYTISNGESQMPLPLFLPEAREAGQCSLKILAQQVRDHSWPVRQTYAPEVHFPGGRGG